MTARSILKVTKHTYYVSKTSKSKYTKGQTKHGSLLELLITAKNQVQLQCVLFPLLTVNLRTENCDSQSIAGRAG